jgi:hypothetical protein
LRLLSLALFALLLLVLLLWCVSLLLLLLWCLLLLLLLWCLLSLLLSPLLLQSSVLLTPNLIFILPYPSFSRRIAHPLIASVVSFPRQTSPTPRLPHRLLWPALVATTAPFARLQAAHPLPPPLPPPPLRSTSRGC